MDRRRLTALIALVFALGAAGAFIVFDSLQRPGDTAAASASPPATRPSAAPKPIPAPIPLPAAAVASTIVPPTFEVVRVGGTGGTVIAGAAEPKARVEIFDGTRAVAAAEANPRGEFAVVLTKPLAPGAHDLSIRATAAGGATQLLSDDRVAVSVPDKPTGDVLVVLNRPGSPSRVLAIPEGKLAPAPAVGGLLGGAAPSDVPRTPTVAIAAVEANSAGAVYVAGIAATPEPVRVYVNNQELGTVAPTLAGSWLLESHGRQLAAGTNTVRADQVTKGGEVIARAEVPFARTIDAAALHPLPVAAGTAAGAATNPTTVVVKEGDNLWDVARVTLGDGVLWSRIYQANRDQIRSPGVIYPGQVLQLPAAKP